MVLTQCCTPIRTVIAQSGNVELILSRRLDEAAGLGEAELSCELLFVKNRGLCLDGYFAGRAACTEVWVLRVQAW